MESTKTKAVKKFGLIIAASVMALSLTGCGKDTYRPVKPGETGNKDNNEPVVNQKLKID